MKRLLPFFALAIAVAPALAVTACNKPLDDDKCQKLVDKMVDLAALEEPPSDHVEKVKAQVKGDKRTLQNVKDTCVGKMTKSQYDCVMGAKSFSDATQCDQK
jgi:hypothetical protein